MRIDIIFAWMYLVCISCWFEGSRNLAFMQRKLDTKICQLSRKSLSPRREDLPDITLLQWNNSSLPNKSISFRNTGKDDNLTFLGGYRQYGAHQFQTLLVGITQRIIQNDRCSAILCHYHGTRQPAIQIPPRFAAKACIRAGFIISGRGLLSPVQPFPPHKSAPNSVFLYIRYYAQTIRTTVPDDTVLQKHQGFSSASLFPI